MAYPTSIPATAAWQAAQDLLSGTFTNNDIEAAWECAGYALSMAFPLSTGLAPQNPKATAAQFQEGKMAIAALASGQKQGAIPWLSIALAILQAIFSNLGG